eukprot:Rmarinus@m.752
MEDAKRALLSDTDEIGHNIKPVQLPRHVSLVEKSRDQTTDTIRTHIEHRHSIETRHGTAHVRELRPIESDGPLIPFVTYHDVGISHAPCFHPFLEFMFTLKPFENFAILHFDAPGHSAMDTPRWENDPVLSLEQLGEMVADVVFKHFKYDKMIGMGIGAGADVLTRTAIFYPTKVIGLILVGPDFSPIGWVDWAKWRATDYHLTHYDEKLSAIAYDSFIQRWFSRSFIEMQEGFVLKTRRESNRMNRTTLSKYVQAYIGRSDISKVVRQLTSTRILVVAPKQSAVHEAALRSFERLPSDSCSLIDVDTGLMVTQERPSALREAMDLFFKHLGFIY